MRLRLNFEWCVTCRNWFRITRRDTVAETVRLALACGHCHERSATEDDR